VRVPREQVGSERGSVSQVFDEDTEQREFLFRLFRHIVVGGSMCQWEDNVRPYLEAARATYKDLLSVAKDALTGGIRVQSAAFQVTALKGEGLSAGLFGHPSSHNVCWVIVDPGKRTAVVWYAPYVPFW
jgi:cilia- and flagella-associated protein 300